MYTQHPFNRSISGCLNDYSTTLLTIPTRAESNIKGAMLAVLMFLACPRGKKMVGGWVSRYVGTNICIQGEKGLILNGKL
jgi:hypothetical protein